MKFRFSCVLPPNCCSPWIATLSWWRALRVPMNLRAMPSGALLLVGSPMAVRSRGRFQTKSGPKTRPQRQSGRMMVAKKLHNGYKGGRRLQQRWAPNCLGLHAIGSWPSLCQGQCGGCLCTSLPTLKDSTHRRSPEGPTITQPPTSPMAIRKW